MEHVNQRLLHSLLEKFAGASESWYSSVRPNGRVHLAPIWHVWLDGLIYVVTQSTSVRARNLAHNPWVSLSLPDPLNVLIIEGMAEVGDEMRHTLRSHYMNKYNWDITSDGDYKLIIRIIPRKLLAWGEHGSGRWKYHHESKVWSSVSE